MKTLAHSFLRRLLTMMTGTSKNQRVIIFGVRRSGNHALTNWLTNAAEECESTLTPQPSTLSLAHCFLSPSGKVVHLNELNELDFRSTWKLFKEARKWTRKCSILIISFEDIRPSEYANFRRLSGKEIHIQRSALEVISSRYHNINQKAQKGIGWSRQTCDAYFLETLRQLHFKGDHSAAQWNYNLWLKDAKWRSNFLKQLGLSHDQMPAHSSVGGGSSFHGTSGKIESDLSSRLRKVQPSEPWKLFLENMMETETDLFSEAEKDACREFLSE